MLSILFLVTSMVTSCKTIVHHGQDIDCYTDKIHMIPIIIESLMLPFYDHTHWLSPKSGISNLLSARD